jgi:signal transduction histidine kinase
MKMSEADKEKLYHLDLIEKRITNLDDFIQDILSYSKNKKNPVLTEKIEFKKAINEILDAVLPIEVAQINIRIEIEDVIPFYSSHERVYAVLNNLISNAIKYRNTTLQNSFIKISVLTNIDGAIITIEDNGVGIKEAYLPKIFDMFYRATTSQTGSGLGLYMVKEILENIKGEITVKSTAGEGTTFVVNLKNMINEVI